MALFHHKKMRSPASLSEPSLRSAHSQIPSSGPGAFSSSAVLSCSVAVPLQHVACTSLALSSIRLSHHRQHLPTEELLTVAFQTSPTPSEITTDVFFLYSSQAAPNKAYSEVLCKQFFGNRSKAKERSHETVLYGRNQQKVLNNVLEFYVESYPFRCSSHHNSYRIGQTRL